MSIRVALVEDSEIASRRIEQILRATDEIQLVGRFETVQELLDAKMLKAADVLLLDMWLPGRHGLSAIRDIAARVPVIIVSDEAPDSPMAQEALAQGAIEFIAKRELSTAEGEDRLCRTIRGAAEGRLSAEEYGILTIVGSTGAPRVLEQLIPQIATTKAAIVLVQHMPDGRAEGFARWLARLGMPARLVAPLDRLRPGRILVAPSGQHTVLIPPQSLRLRPAEADDFHVPSGDRLLGSAAALGPRVVSLVLSGLGSDGAEGAAQVLKAGGQVLVQLPTEAAAPSMPRSTLDLSPRVRPVAVAQLGEEVLRALERT